MKTLAIGSTNVPKVQALEEIIKHYPLLAGAKVHSMAVSSDVSDQPLSLEETILGAKTRAMKAFKQCEGCDLGFGVESGLMRAAGTQTGFFNVCICCIYTGKTHHIGMSTGFEVPAPILKLVLEQNMDLNTACCKAAITEKTNVGSHEGLIGILTNGRVNRKEYSKQSIAAALVQLEHAKWFV